ncbi:MAG TPA: AMP-binding protein [Gammaproteobacteria bacterium]
MLIGDLLRDTAARRPDHVALISGDRRLSYAQFDDQANRLANALLALSLERGARVAVLSANRAEYAIAYFGLARTPFVSAHCSTRCTPAELAFMLDHLGAEYLLVESRFADMVDAVRAGLRKPVHCIFLDEPGERIGVGDFRLAELIGSHSPTPPDVSRSATAPFAITMTGGTTGVPKFVVVSHKARCASVVAAFEDFGIGDSDVVVASTPLFHTAGLFVWFGTAVMAGASVVMLEAWDVERFIQLVSREKITAAFFVPSQLNDLISHPMFDPEPLASLRNIGYAGAPMGRALFERTRIALPHVAFTENYGQSEACPITIRRESDGVEKLGTVGRPAINAEVAILDSDRNLVGPGEVGDIVTRGDQLFDGYFGDPEETAKAFRAPDGWLLTGDVGYLDADGFLTLVDRSKDMLVSGGENIYPAEIENALYQHEAVAECAVFGIPDERWGEVPAAHVVLSPQADVAAEELIDFCASRIARFKRPRLVKFVASLPKTPVGKIRKDAIRAPYWEGRDRRI